MQIEHRAGDIPVSSVEVSRDGEVGLVTVKLKRGSPSPDTEVTVRDGRGTILLSDGFAWTHRPTRLVLTGTDDEEREWLKNKELLHYRSSSGRILIYIVPRPAILRGRQSLYRMKLEG